MARNFGLDQGFDTFRLLAGKRIAATDVNAAAADWLGSGEEADAPFFLYLHTMEPHAPYIPPQPFRQRFAANLADERLTRMKFLERLEKGEFPATPEIRQSLLGLYDAEIAANDAAFGELIDLLVQRGLWEDTVIVFVSDHGEEFLDHDGWEHGKTLHTEMLDVPLIVRVPGLAGTVVERQAQQVDVVPTVLEALGLPLDAGLEGRSLLSWMAGAEGGQPGPAGHRQRLLLDRRAGPEAGRGDHPRWRLIEKRFPVTGVLLFDRQADPGEQHDLAAERPVRAGYLLDRLHAAERRRKGKLQAGEATMSPEVQKQLRALGYLN